ncbi:P-loop NTPase [candidate division KSB1 bacterium]|nr:P-loop NTPase [candidate division KSB1 bacterium]
MKLAIASGKGGTGKTTIATNLAVTLAKHGYDITLCDTDVEAPNGHLFLEPEFDQQKAVDLLIPEVNESLCTLCGRCSEICEFNAIMVLGESVMVFPELCHACGGCTQVCPENAIHEIRHRTGTVSFGTAKNLSFVQGELAIGEAKAPPVIKEVKREIHSKIVIIDAPPGTSCPVVEATQDADFVLLVTEPTPFGYNDLVMATEMVEKLERPFGVLVNRADSGDSHVIEYCNMKRIPILMQIPEKRAIAEAYSAGRLLVEACPEYEKQFLTLFTDIQDHLKIESPHERTGHH